MTDVLTPQQIVDELNRYVIGQTEAKRRVANALRSRWRRMQLQEDMREEVVPKNILMIGPTGVGKTEIARRLAHLAQAPFVKADATKFTEVGYVGRDVDSIIRDLVDTSIKMAREEAMSQVQSQAEKAAEERMVALLMERKRDQGHHLEENDFKVELWTQLREGRFDDEVLEIEVPAAVVGVEIMAPPGMEEMSGQLQSILQNMGSQKTKVVKMSVKDALEQFIEEEGSKLVNEEDIVNQGLEDAENKGIVFLDEIDKVIQSSERGGMDVSREGVQRDLLPLIEGTTVSTKYGHVSTDHILFIASGAFLGVKPTDMISELQGRLPIRVQLNALTEEDFAQILVDPKAALTKQYAALLAVDGVELDFQPDGVARIAHIAFALNERTVNIGARRLHAIMEKLLEEVSFQAPDYPESLVRINAAFVDKQLGELVTDEDLTKWVL